MVVTACITAAAQTDLLYLPSGANMHQPSNRLDQFSCFCTARG